MDVVVAACRVLQKILATHTGYTTMGHLSHAAKQQLLLLTPVSAPRAKTTSIRGMFYAFPLTNLYIVVFGSHFSG